jgi:S1-C subfamily serine protease
MKRLLLVTLLGLGCSSSSSSTTVKRPAGSSPQGSARPEPARPRHLPRAAVLATVSQGLGAFLGRLDTEPVLVGGRFRGWRIVRLADHDPLWNGVDLQPGDVVTSVNGRPIERPEQALTAFQSLSADPQLRVSYERNGQPRELTYVIDDR